MLHASLLSAAQFSCLCSSQRAKSQHNLPGQHSKAYLLQDSCNAKALQLHRPSLTYCCKVGKGRPPPMPYLTAASFAR